MSMEYRDTWSADPNSFKSGPAGVSEDAISPPGRATGLADLIDNAVFGEHLPKLKDINADTITDVQSDGFCSTRTIRVQKSIRIH
jgi:hypothetical protein